MLLFIAVFVALLNAACLQDASVDTAFLTAASTCTSNAIVGAAAPATKAAAVCTCISTFAAAIQTQCDVNTLAVTGLCAGATILNGLTDSLYDFNTCGTCANPPATTNFPSACSQCIIKYTSCLTTGYFNAVAYPSISDIMSPKKICGCLGQFYSCFNGCGSPLSQFVGNYCNTYNFCGCDGSLNVANGHQIIAYLKTIGFSTFQTNIKNAAGASILSIDCVTKTTAAGNGLSTDRFLCDIDFSGTVDYPAFHGYLTNYLGKESTVALGQFLNGPVVSVKRDSTEAMVSSTYTIVVEGNSGSALGAALSTLLILGAILALFF